MTNIEKNLGIRHNVSFNIIDQASGKIVRHHQGHNSATNSILVGIGHYLAGDGVFNQGYEMLRYWVPQYISLGTMGLISQDEDSSNQDSNGNVIHLPMLSVEDCHNYLSQTPGYGADGYDNNHYNNNRPHIGLGPTYEMKLNSIKQSIPTIESIDALDCELISSSYLRSKISFREVVPESQSEMPRTIDVALTAMISTGALEQFRNGRDYLYISEAGLWSNQRYIQENNNGLLAGYRITPPNMDSLIYHQFKESLDINNINHLTFLRPYIQQEILRVGFNQIVQIVWKIQIGSIEDLNSTYMNFSRRL